MSTSPTIIDFKKNIGGQKVKGRGIVVDENLIVSYSVSNDKTYQVYRLHDGRLFVPVTFTNLEDCVEMAKWWAETYREFFCLWKDYPDADIIALAKFSVKNGIRIHELIQQIKHKQVDKPLLSWAWENADVKSWIRS
jgi:hypothetical protein